jgi:hypothetical protein
LHRSKFIASKKGFCAITHGNRPFTAERLVFDGAGYVQIQCIQRERPKPKVSYQKYAFRPSNPNKAGFVGCFEKVDYLEEGGPDEKTKQAVEMKLSRTQPFGKPWRYFLTTIIGQTLTELLPDLNHQFN